MIKTYKKLFLSLGAVIILSTGTAICAQASTAGWVSEDGVWKPLEIMHTTPGKSPVITLIILTATESLL